jgi:hypothetical protein
VDERILPVDISDAIELSAWARLDEEGADKVEAELKERIKILGRRLKKTKSYVKDIRKSSRNQNLSAEKIFRADCSEQKRERLKKELETVCRNYSALLAARAGVPMDFVFNSKVYIKDDEINVLLGYYDDNIGQCRHGHYVYNIRTRKYSYARLPFEQHGPEHHFDRPVDEINLMLKKYYKKGRSHH